MADRENSTVLLKNADGLLPLDPAKVKSIAVIGWADGLHIMTHGGKPSSIALAVGHKSLGLSCGLLAGRWEWCCGAGSSGVAVPGDPQAHGPAAGREPAAGHLQPDDSRVRTQSTLHSCAPFPNEVFALQERNELHCAEGPRRRAAPCGRGSDGLLPPVPADGWLRQLGVSRTAAVQHDAAALPSLRTAQPNL